MRSPNNSRITSLHKAMPQGYIKATQALLSFPRSQGYIYANVTHPGKDKEVLDALSWVAMENILGKMLEMPSKSESNGKPK